MRKLALALLIAAVALPAFGETLPTVIVIRGGDSSGKSVTPAAAPQTMTVCWVRINSIGNMPYRHCAEVERLTVEFPPAPSAAFPPAPQY